MTEVKHAGLSAALVEAIAGLSAGLIATLTVHPLDIVKTRMQSRPPKHKHIKPLRLCFPSHLITSRVWSRLEISGRT